MLYKVIWFVNYLMMLYQHPTYRTG